MKTSLKKKAIISICLFIAAFGISATVHAATSMFSHGNVSQVEYPNLCDYIYRGWGLDLTQDSGTANWIHMTVPTPIGPGQNGTNAVRLKFWTGSVDAFVDRIDIYNGNVMVHSFTGLSLSNGWKDLLFNMAKYVKFSRGLGISIHIAAGVESMSHRFVFSSAGAYFY